VPLAGVDAEDWRPAFQAAHPQWPDWFATDRTDLSRLLPSLPQPVLLLWGDADPLSPVAVGQRLEALLPNARLQVIAGGDHDLSLLHADAVAPLIDAHLLGASELEAPAIPPP